MKRRYGEKGKLCGESWKVEAEVEYEIWRVEVTANSGQTASRVHTTRRRRLLTRPEDIYASEQLLYMRRILSARSAIDLFGWHDQSSLGQCQIANGA